MSVTKEDIYQHLVTDVIAKADANGYTIEQEGIEWLVEQADKMVIAMENDYTGKVDMMGD